MRTVREGFEKSQERYLVGRKTGIRGVRGSDLGDMDWTAVEGRQY